MDVHFPLLSMLSTIVLVGALILGAEVTLYDVHIHLRTTDSGFDISIHPTWLCWMDTHDVFRGFCYGNVMVCDCTLPSEMHKERIVAHEARHLEQWRALGLWTWAAGLVLPLEPEFTDWSDPSVELEQMWKPPSQWPDQWHLISITVKEQIAVGQVL